MNFLRPEVRALLWRWREVIVTGALTLWGVHLIGRAVERASLGTGIVGVAVTGVCAVLLSFALLRARMHRNGGAAGVVEVDERELRYLGPEEGAFVSLDDLTRLDIVTGAGQSHWVLSHLAGPAVIIPAGAQGAEQLFDAVAALPGVRIEDAVRAMDRDGRHMIWRRTGLN